MDARLRGHDNLDAALSPLALAPALALAFPNARRSDEGKGKAKAKAKAQAKAKVTVRTNALGDRVPPMVGLWRQSALNRI